MPEFHMELSADCRWLQDLPEQNEPLTVWHGDSASEQLMLARVAFWLGDAALDLHEVDCGTGQSHTSGRRAVSQCSPQQLAAFVPRQVFGDRRRQLADTWAIQRALPAVLRCWRAGQFVASDYSAPDAALIAACNNEWRPLPRVMAAVMKEADGYFPSDYFVYWRARLLAVQGKLVIEGDARQGYAGLRVRSPA